MAFVAVDSRGQMEPRRDSVLRDTLVQSNLPTSDRLQLREGFFRFESRRPRYDGSEHLLDDGGKLVPWKAAFSLGVDMFIAGMIIHTGRVAQPLAEPLSEEYGRLRWEELTLHRELRDTASKP